MFDVPLHKLIIHFPVALMIIGAVYDAWAVYSKQPELHETGYGLTLWASFLSRVAVVTGLQLADATRSNRGPVTGHALFGIVVAIMITALGIARYSAHQREQLVYRTSWLIVECAAAVLVFVTAVMGHRL